MRRLICLIRGHRWNEPHPEYWNSHLRCNRCGGHKNEVITVTDYDGGLASPGVRGIWWRT